MQLKPCKKLKSSKKNKQNVLFSNKVKCSFQQVKHILSLFNICCLDKTPPYETNEFICRNMVQKNKKVPACTICFSVFRVKTVDETT